MRNLAHHIDALYQAPLDEFTSARAALAKSIAGKDAAFVKRLKKPAVVAWTVNQLYWRARASFDRLVASGRALRAAQIAALKGRATDVRSATDAHRRAVADAVHQAVQLAGRAALSPNPDALARMFEAISLAPELPASPGRFTDVMRPAGFEALAGVTPAARPHPRPRPVEAPAPPTSRNRSAERKAQRAHEQQRRRAETALKSAGRTLQRARDAEARAREALTRAEADLRSAEDAEIKARSQRDLAAERGGRRAILNGT